jgi:osmotically-inducible protein OsmY
MPRTLPIIAIALAGLAACSSNREPDVASKIRSSLKQAGLNNVSVSQDTVKGVVTLTGSVQQGADKSRAEQIAGPLANGQVLADEIQVLPNGYASTARTLYSDLDRGIEANLDAAFIQANIKGIHHSTNNGVVKLTGNVNTPELRATAARTASGVPNVQQVVNELDVKNQRATASTADADRYR